MSDRDRGPGTPGRHPLDERLDIPALHRLASVAPRSVDEDLVIHEILSGVREVISCHRPVLFLYDEDGDQMTIYSTEDGPAQRLSMSEPSVVRRVFHSGRGEIVNDLIADADTSPLVADAFGARQIVGAPLSTGGKRLGVVTAINSKRSGFTEDDLARLSVLADQGALALENSQLRAAFHRQSQELEGLHRMSRVMTSSESMDHVISSSVGIVADLIECEKVAVLLYQPEGELLIAHPKAIGIPPEEIESLRVSLAQPSLASTVFRTDAPLISNDAPNDAWVNPILQQMLKMETALVVPLRTSGDPLGVLMTVNATKGHFDRADTRFAALLANRIATIVESIRARDLERALVQKLRETDQTKSDFVSMLAHELKGPMTTVMGFTQVLHDQFDKLTDEKREHILNLVMRETSRLSRLVSDLLDLSRMEAGTLRYDFVETSFNEVLDQILEVHTSLRAKHMLISEVPDDLPQVWADPDRLRQVLINLITNATRYSPENTTVTIAAEAVQVDGKKSLKVTVIDEGIGIAPEDQDRVFDKFSMLEKPGWVKKGTGLGLYITRGIVHAHGGNLWVDSARGRGAKFNFTLPLAD